MRRPDPNRNNYQRNGDITYCHDGFRSTLAWRQLKALGYSNVSVYNGGRSDRDRILTLPVVKGNQPLDADFAL